MRVRQEWSGTHGCCCCCYCCCCRYRYRCRCRCYCVPHRRYAPCPLDATTHRVGRARIGPGVTVTLGCRPLLLLLALCLITHEHRPDRPGADAGTVHGGIVVPPIADCALRPLVPLARGPLPAVDSAAVPCRATPDACPLAPWPIHAPDQPRPRHVDARHCFAKQRLGEWPL